MLYFISQCLFACTWYLSFFLCVYLLQLLSSPVSPHLFHILLPLPRINTPLRQTIEGKQHLWEKISRWFGSPEEVRLSRLPQGTRGGWVSTSLKDANHSDPDPVFWAHGLTTCAVHLFLEGSEKKIHRTSHFTCIVWLSMLVFSFLFLSKCT